MTAAPIPTISALLTAYNPRFATANYALMKQWIAEGADLDRDILPVIRRWISKKQNIYSLGFFTPYIRQAIGQNRKPTPVSDAERAKHIAYVTRRLGMRIPHEERWLSQYETEHGAINA